MEWVGRSWYWRYWGEADGEHLRLQQSKSDDEGEQDDLGCDENGLMASLFNEEE